MAGFAKQHGGQECEAYTSFRGVLDNIRERYAELNPKTGAVCGTDKRYTGLIRWSTVRNGNGIQSEEVLLAQWLLGKLTSMMFLRSVLILKE